MTKEVLINISGIQMEDEPIETLSAGNYYFKDGTHYVFFEEVAEGVPGVTKTQIRLNGKESLEVIKRGVSAVHMIFEKNKHNRCYYETPFGQLNLGIFTTDIYVEESEENINIKVEYALDVNHEPLSECTIRINVKPRDSKEFSISEKMNF